MKKQISILLVSAMVMCLAGCGAGQGTQSAQPNEEPAVSEEAPEDAATTPDDADAVRAGRCKRRDSWR